MQNSGEPAPKDATNHTVRWTFCHAITEWVMTVELCDAYVNFFVIVAPKQIYFLRFAFQGQTSPFKGVVFGLYLEPRIFIRCMQVACHHWWQEASGYCYICTIGLCVQFAVFSLINKNWNIQYVRYLKSGNPSTQFCVNSNQCLKYIYHQCALGTDQSPIMLLGAFYDWA